MHQRLVGLPAADEADGVVTRPRPHPVLWCSGPRAFGDPTVDLAVAWELLDPPGRDLFRSLLGVDEATWLRGRAGALAIAAMTFPYYWETMPDRCATRPAMARAVLADAATCSLKGP